jgi:hypothetical protein
MDRTAPRIAGNVGCGGPWRILFSSARFSEAAALQIGVGDHRHERVAVQAMPGSAFEVVEAEFFLELLVGLFADPSGLDRGGEGLEVGVGRQVGKIAFALARGAALADQPGLLAGHVLHALVMDALWRTIGDIRTRTAAKEAAKGPLVPLRQLTRRHFAVARTSSAGAES